MTARLFGRCSQVYESPGCAAVTPGARPTNPVLGTLHGQQPKRGARGPVAGRPPGHQPRQVRPQPGGWPLVPV